MASRASHLSALRILACVAALVWLASCSGPRSDLNRIAPPVRFADLRETASWIHGFDPSWWTAIDRAYAEYDRAIDEASVRRWDEVVADLSRDLAANRSKDARGIRLDAGAHREVDSMLAARERALFAALESSLPRDAEGFVGLASARTAFRRASEMLRGGEGVVPGPLEVMQTRGRRALTAAELEAATASYIRLAAVAQEFERGSIQRFVSLRADIVPLEARLAELASNDSPAKDLEPPVEEPQQDDGPAQERAAVEASRAARVSRWGAETERARETVRLALLHEGTLFGRAIADESEREEYLDQLDLALHEGIRVAPGIRGFARIARAVLERRSPADRAALSALDALVEQELARHARLREQLRSGGVAARKAAYEALQKVGDPIGEFIGKRLESNGGVWAVLARTGDVVAGLRTAESAADEILAPSASDPSADSDRFPGVSRGEVQILIGTSLDPGVLSALSTRIGLGPDEEAHLRASVERELASLNERGERLFRSLQDSVSQLDRDRPKGEEARRRVDRVMAEFSTGISQMRQLDAAANEAVLSEAASLAGTDAADLRVRIARAELALLLEVGAGGDNPKTIYEPITGVAPPSLSNPFELARKAARTAVEREAAEQLVLERADELVAAHREIAAGLRKSVRDFLLFVVDVQGGKILGSYRWDAKPLGGRATALRIDIARELAAALGDAYGDRLLEGWLREAAPEIAPRRTAEFHDLDRFAADPAKAGMEGAVVAELLDGADERRREAIREFLAWRGGFIQFGGDGEIRSPVELARAAPTGWILRARIEDCDERAISACESALVGVRSPGRVFPLLPLVSFRPRFE